MLGFGKSQIKLDRDLYDRVKKIADIAGYATVEEFVTPDAFRAYAAIARAKGFLLVAASPLTRSSYHAGDDFRKMQAARAALLAKADAQA